MNRLRALLCATFCAVSAPGAAIAQAGTLEVTAGYRERIALPPEALLEVQILQAPNEGGAPGVITSQVFGMTTVPMTVALGFDPAVLQESASHSVRAAIYSPEGDLLFRGTQPVAMGGDAEDASAEILMTMPDDAGAYQSVAPDIVGVAWRLAEVFGDPWESDDPATLTIEGDLSFAMRGACNSFSGQMARVGGGILFPENIATTMMACPEPAEAWDRRLLAALGRVSGFVRYGEGLVMTDRNGEALLHFVRSSD